MIAIIDNYDSFTHNIAQSLAALTDEPIKILRSKSTTVAQIEELKPSRLIISPGPGSPKDAGISIEAILHFKGKIPILGVCLGHQAIGEAFGGKIISAKAIKHGVVEEIALDSRGLFRLIGKKGTFTRYHSLAIEESSLPSDLIVSARASDGEIMGVRHRHYDIEGVQFHPESIASKNVREFFGAFLSYKKENLPTAAILSTLIRKNSLSRKDAHDFMEDLTDGFANEIACAAILSLIEAKGASTEEIVGCAEALIEKKTALKLPANLELTDIVGTGGDEKNSFNISSMAAILAASCGLNVAKHGNRAVSSKSGAADFFEKLGVKIDNPPAKTAQILEKTGFAFLFAPIYHGAMKNTANIRAKLGVKTIMNLIGPLCNPAGAAFQLIGVYDKSLLCVVAKSAKMLGAKRVMVVSSEDGFDEISPCARSFVAEILEDGALREYEICPSDFGLSALKCEDLSTNDAAHNANIALEMLKNPANHGYAAIEEAVLLNAAAAIYIGKKAPDLKSAYAAAKAALSSGKCLEKLEAIKAATNAI